MKNFKKIIALALAAVMVFALAACGGNNGGTTGGNEPAPAPAPAASGEAAPAATGDFAWNGQTEIWSILPTTGVPALMAHSDSCGWYAMQHGFTNYVAKDAQGNPANQADLIEQAIAAGNVGALMIAAMSVDLIKDACQAAADAGIAIVFLGAEPNGYQIGGCVYTAYEITGQQAVLTARNWAENAGVEIPKNADGKYEIAVDTYYDIIDGTYRSNAIVGTVNENADFFTMVSNTQSYGDASFTTAYNNAQAVLSANPDCHIFIAYEPDNAMGIAQAIADYVDQYGGDLASYCVVPCYGLDETFQGMYAEAKANPSANAVKGFITYGGSEMIVDENGVERSPVGVKLGELVVGVTTQDGITWNYGDTYYDTINAYNVTGYEYEWKMGEENPAIQYKTPEVIK
ncbi:MAG: sugar ABC transporter substrate-binding protein [Parasporobacterium sp.]|nr:sugar ABC transporter substrate-binding protein [Parasporobacterium sp.]